MNCSMIVMLTHIWNHKVLCKPKAYYNKILRVRTVSASNTQISPPVRGMRECSHFKTNQGSYAQLTASPEHAPWWRFSTLQDNSGPIRGSWAAWAKSLWEECLTPNPTTKKLVFIFHYLLNKNVFLPWNN